MESVIRDLSQLDKNGKMLILNSLALSSLKRQDLALKVCFIVGLNENDPMCDQLLFYGIDIGIIPKERSLKITKCVELKSENGLRTTCPLNLPDKGLKGFFFPPSRLYTDFDRKVFRLFRRMTKPYNYLDAHPCFFDDDIHELKYQMSLTGAGMYKYFLNDAAFFGAVRCFKHLLQSGATPSQQTM